MRDPRASPRAADLPVERVQVPNTSVFATILMLARRPGFLWIMLGGMCGVFLIYASGAWLPPFFIRVYGMNTAAIGRFAAISVGVGGGIGTLGAGSLCDLLRKRIQEVEAKVLIAALGLAVPTLIVTVLTRERPVALASMFFFNVCIYSVLAPSVRVTQRAATAETRGLAVALGTLMAIPNLAFGLPLVGAISDLLTPRYGRDALRYALATCSVAGLIGSFAYWRVHCAFRSTGEDIF
jgi:hypothetical protein